MKKFACGIYKSCFEDRVSNYSKAGVGGVEGDKEFDLDADF
jgi:hypothetical protein